MGMKYTNIFHSKALQNIPKLFLVFNYLNHQATLNVRMCNLSGNLLETDPQ
jgi:hypothetical protein